MAQSNESGRTARQEGRILGVNGRLSIASLLLLIVVSSPALAADRPPLSPDQVTPAVTPSSISATIEIAMSSLGSAVERMVPRRLATFNDRMTECWHRRILGRQIDVDCIYSGYVERVGGVPLRAEGGRLTAATPLFGTVSAQGTGRFTSRLHGTAEGQMTVFASARPQLRKDWSVSLDMSEGFHWTEPPTLTILGFRINLERYVEPRIRDQLGRVKATFDGKVRAIDVRGKATAAWQQAFAAVKIVDAPEIWLQTTPQTIAFSGIRARSNMLESSVDISGTTETVVGAQPPAPAPTPLPSPGGDVSKPGQFSIIIPVNISYDQIRQKFQDVLAARAPNSGLNLREISVYPSAGKLVAGLRLAPSGDGTSGGDWVYLTAVPQVDSDANVLQLADLAFVSNPSIAEGTPLAGLLGDPTLIQTLRQQVRLAFQDELLTIITSANARLTRPLADGFRSEGNLTSAGLAKILLLSDGLRLDLRASGDLRILYGL
jgi:hypothetical protein